MTIVKQFHELAKTAVQGVRKGVNRFVIYNLPHNQDRTKPIV